MNVKQIMKKHPIVKEMSCGEPIFWKNPQKVPWETYREGLEFSRRDIDDAEKRLLRFAPYLAQAFPKTKSTNGIIESKLVEISNMKESMEKRNILVDGSLYLKCDSHLPVSGSIKARGGIYEVLKYAETLALEHGMISIEDDYRLFNEPKMTDFLTQYSVAVGSTGNLGLSIGIMSAKLGFKVTVHMSADAREWKKELLRSKGVKVLEYEDDYEKAVAEGRKLAEEDPKCHFVDDEKSRDLFLGYAVAGRRLAKQLKEADIEVSQRMPLNVYIPCGVGGAPGGVAFGLKDEFGDDVHVYFAEPVEAPAMTLGLITGMHDEISAKDIGLTGVTAADGLAVTRPSGLVGPIMQGALDGCFTIKDEELYNYLHQLADSEGIWIEPSACAAFPGPHLAGNGGTHILWATGGSMVPREELDKYYRLGLEIDEK